MQRKIRLLALFFAVLLLAVQFCGCGADTPEEKGPPRLVTMAATAPAETTAPADTEPYVKQTFDPDEVYRHVFEEHSRKLTAEEVETVTPDTAGGEAIIAFLYNCDVSTDWSFEQEDYYLVSRVSTDLQGFNDKYFAVVNTYSNIEARCDIVDDYHEAYLDVMFEHLTFAPCGSIPGTSDMAYDIGYICSNTTEQRYELRADGYVYYQEQGACFKSEQLVDAAYLASMLLSSYRYALNSKEHAEDVHYWNENVPAGGEIYAFDRKGELPVIDGAAYERLGDSWVYVQDRHLSQHGLIGVYANRVIAYPDAISNSHLNYPDY